MVGKMNMLFLDKLRMKLKCYDVTDVHVFYRTKMTEGDLLYIVVKLYKNV